MSNDIIIAAIAAIVTITGSIIIYKKDIKIKELDLNLVDSKTKNVKTSIKVSVLDNLLKMSVYSTISDAVTDIFLNTKVERFMIFIAVNGVSDFSVVSIIFERYKELSARTNALARYHNVKVDKPYKDMLKACERDGFVEVDSSELQPQILKDIYDMERIKHSIVSFVDRRKIDDFNYLIIFSSAATTLPFAFNNIDKLHIKNCVESVLQPNI